MLILTMDTVPEGMRVSEFGGIITSRSSVQVSQKGFLQGFFERKRNEDQEAIDTFADVARTVKLESGRAPNAILGVKMTTSAQQFKDGTMLLVTYYGTTAYIEEDE